MLVPNLCYPAYTAYNETVGVINVPYHFDTSSENITVIYIMIYLINYILSQYDNLSRALEIGRAEHGVVKSLLIVNPHNPTGKLLNHKQMEEVVQFCVENQLVLIACEMVNTLDRKSEFISFLNVITKMPKPYNQLEYFSVNSVSNSFNK